MMLEQEHAVTCTGRCVAQCSCNLHTFLLTLAMTAEAVFLKVSSPGTLVSGSRDLVGCSL